MGSKNELTRKDFLTLTFTLIGTGAVAATCSSSNNNAADAGGTAGTTGHGGTTGGGGSSHSTGQGGTSGGGGTSANGGGGGTSTSSCADPLPEQQVADTTGHMHTVTIHPSVLDSTTAQMFDTSVTSGHMHMVTLEPAMLATLKNGGNVTVMSTIVMSHGHMFAISCH